MWKVTSVTSDRSSRWTASHTEASSPCGGGGRSSGTGDRQPSGRLVGFVEVESLLAGAVRRLGSGSLTRRLGCRSGAWGTPFVGGRKSREKPPRAVALGYRLAREAAPILSVSHEAHLPAQEAQARPYARVPRAHAHPCRPRDVEAPARQGPQAAHSLSDGGIRRARRPAAFPAPAPVPER